MCACIFLCRMLLSRTRCVVRACSISSHKNFTHILRECTVLSMIYPEWCCTIPQLLLRLIVIHCAQSWNVHAWNKWWMKCRTHVCASNLNLYFTHLKAKQTTKSSKFYVINNMSNTYKTRFSSRKNPKKNCVRIKWLDKQWRYSIGAKENFHTEIWRNDFDVGYSQSCNINFSLMESCFSATFTLQKRCLCERSFPKMSK